MINEQILKCRVLTVALEKQRKLPLTPELDTQLKKLKEEAFTLSFWQELSEPWKQMAKEVKKLPLGTTKTYMVLKMREIDHMIPDDFVDFLEADNQTLRNEILNMTGEQMKLLNVIGNLQKKIEELEK